jgi:alcohol dehydrogenase (cytochrome c)
VNRYLSVALASIAIAGTAASVAAAENDWPSYNRTLTSDRYSPLAKINTGNVGNLKVLCTYDTGEHGSFQTGILVTNGALIGTTEKDTFSINPSTCKENWRVHEEGTSANPLKVNRGAAYLDGRIFRGTQDGRVVAYDFKTGKQLWSTTIADSTKLHESVPAAPIAWNGMVFVGQAGGDNRGVKGRMYALDATTGKIVWETYLVPKGPQDVSRGPSAPPLALAAASWKNSADVPISGGATWTTYSLDPESGTLYIPVGNPAPDFVNGLREGENLFTGSMLALDAKTGAYRNHWSLVKNDWHDWDVDTAPSIVKVNSGKKMLFMAPKNGYLYGVDLSSNSIAYKVPVTRIENADAQFTPGKKVRVCPGAIGGAEWNGAAYDPKNNLVVTGEVEWCAAVVAQTDTEVKAVKAGDIWPGMQTNNPLNAWGEHDPASQWAGWLYGSNAETGKWKWRLKTNFPILGGVTPTAGGVVFFGDIGGNFYAVDSATGKQLWKKELDGAAIGGGVITYEDAGSQKVAVAAGMTSPLWPVKVSSEKVVIFGL